MVTPSASITAPGEFIPLVIDGETVGQVPVDDILP